MKEEKQVGKPAKKVEELPADETEKQRRLAELKTKYTVPAEEVEKITQVIFNRLTSKIEGGIETPTMVIIGGQPGAGKTGLMTFTNTELGKGKVVVVDIDDFRKYHPAFEEIKEKYPDYYVDFTAKFISDVSHVITPMLIDGRYNLIMHKTLGGPAVIEDTIIPGLEAGYYMALRVMAVSALQSKLSALRRTQETRDYIGMVRWVNKDHHDNVYSGMLDVVDTIEKQKLSNLVEVYMRGEKEEKPERVYSNIITPTSNHILTSSDKRPYRSAREAIERSRELCAWNCLESEYEGKMETAKQKAKLYSAEKSAKREQGYIDELEAMVAAMKKSKPE